MSGKHNAIVERDIESLRQTVLDMAQKSQAILLKSLDGVWEQDPTIQDQVKQDDLEIDRLDVAIDDAVLRVLALQAPVASDLRLVVAIKAMATDLERIGDLARNIAGCARRLTERPEIQLPEGLRPLANDCVSALDNAIRAFQELDVKAAQAVLDADDSIDNQEDQLVKEAIARLTGAPETTSQEVDLIFIIQNLERIGDHATNIAEEVVLAAEAKNLKHIGKLSKS